MYDTRLSKKRVAVEVNAFAETAFMLVSVIDMKVAKTAISFLKALDNC